MRVPVHVHWKIWVWLSTSFRDHSFCSKAKSSKSDNGFAWIAAQAAQPLLEPLLNMHTASYMSVISRLKYHKRKGGVHIMGEICPRSDPDIAHMKYSIDPLKLIYRPLLSIIIVYQRAYDSGLLEFSHVKSP